MASPASKATDGGRVDGLDGLRGLAALGVLLFHLWVYSEVLPQGTPVRTLGDQLWHSTRWGLLLFFVLSGFLLYRPWVRAALGGRDRPALGRYFRLRAARIAPGYYLALAGAVLIGLVSAPYMHMPTHGTGPLFLVFGQNFSDHSLNTLDSPMWTLPIELSFYLALPVIGIATVRLGRGRLRQSLLVLAVVAIGIAWAHLATGLWLHGVVLPQMLPYFGFGMLAAVLVEGRALSVATSRALVLAALLAYALNLALHAWAPVAASLGEDMPVALGFAALVAVAAAGEWVPRLLRSRPTVGLGVISYGVYLWHVPLMCLLGAHGLLPRSLWIEPLIVLPLTLLAAWASWRAVERPVLSWAHRRRGERRPRPRPEPAARARDLRRPAPAMVAARHL